MVGQNVKNIQHALKNFFYQRNFSVLSSLFWEKVIMKYLQKKEKKSFFFWSPRLAEGGGQSLGDMIFLRPPLPSYRAELHYHAAGLPGPVLHQYHRQLKISMF